MAHCGESFLQILQDNTPLTFDNNAIPASRNNSIQWEDEESFEVSEDPNAAFSDVNLAEALRSIDNEDGQLETRTQNLSRATDRAGVNGELNLKEELRAKIQTRRLSAGVGELQVQFEPPKFYPLSPEETEKVQKRKRRNRVSANRSRLKRKIREDCLQKEVEDLETANDKLSKEIKFLKKIKHVLSFKIANHQCTKQEMTTSLNTRNSGEIVNMQRAAKHRTVSDYTMKSKLPS